MLHATSWISAYNQGALYASRPCISLTAEQILEKGITHSGHGNSRSIGCHPELKSPQQDGQRHHSLKQRKLITCT